MKSSPTFLATCLSLTVAIPLFAAASSSHSSSAERKELRVLAGPEREPRPPMPRGGAPKMKEERETVPFLGVEASPTGAALSAQLGLLRETGLVINHLVPDSPAASVLQPHDVLLQLDDQLLIEVRQLSVLVRSRKIGDEVTLTYVRGGQKSTAKVKLGQHEVPKFSGPTGGWPGVLDQREDADRLLSLMQRARPAPDGRPGFVPPPARIRIDHEGAPGFRAMSVHTNNSSLVFSDGEGSLELTMKDGAKSLVAKDAAGAELFSGPVTTPKEREALPEAVRQRLEKLESMHDVSFRTGGDFKPAAAHVRPRSISVPLRPHDAPAPGARF